MWFILGVCKDNICLQLKGTQQAGLSVPQGQFNWETVLAPSLGVELPVLRAVANAAVTISDVSNLDTWE